MIISETRRIEKYTYDEWKETFRTWVREEEMDSFDEDVEASGKEEYIYEMVWVDVDGGVIEPGSYIGVSYKGGTKFNVMCVEQGVNFSWVEASYAREDQMINFIIANGQCHN